MHPFSADAAPAGSCKKPPAHKMNRGRIYRVTTSIYRHSRKAGLSVCGPAGPTDARRCNGRTRWGLLKAEALFLPTAPRGNFKAAEYATNAPHTPPGKSRAVPRVLPPAGRSLQGPDGRHLLFSQLLRTL